MTAVLSALIAVSALLAIACDCRGARRGVYVFKPLTTALILVLALWTPAPVSELYRWMIVCGLAFSLAGDVFLMLPRDRFVAGLVSFLVAHLFYIAAFNSEAGRPDDAPWALALLAVYGLVLMRVLWRHLGSLKTPVIVYAAVLLAMAWLAAEQWAAEGSPRTLLAMIGAALFVVSDSTLAVNRFARPFAASQAVVLGTYWAAQWLIARSIAT